MEYLVWILPFSLFLFINTVFLVKNPVYGVLSFIAVVAHAVVALILLDLEFLAYVLAIVYIGAIVVLFLFVIMMFYVKHSQARRSYIRGCLEFYLFGLILSSLHEYFLFYTNYGYLDYSDIILNTNFVALMSQFLYNEYAYITILAGLIMLVGILGAIVLTVKNSAYAHNVMVNNSRNKIIDSIKKVK